jgi:hypothetical protein
VCAYNEAPIIADKAENLLSLREAAGGNLDILVYVDGTDDGALLSLDPAKFRNRLRQDVEMARLLATASQRLRLPAAHDPLSCSFNHLQFRFASLLVDPSAHPFREIQ